MIICPKCGTTNEDDAEFCKACEAPLAVAEQPAKKPGIPRWILVVCGVIVVLGVIAKIFDSGDAGGSARSNTTATSASSRAETSRAAETTSKAATGANTRWSRESFVTAYNAKVPAIWDSDEMMLTEVRGHDTTAGYETLYKCWEGQITVSLIEDSLSELSKVTFIFTLGKELKPSEVLAYAADKALTPALVIENLNSLDDLDRFRTTLEYNDSTTSFETNTPHADYSVDIYVDLGCVSASLKLK